MKSFRKTLSATLLAGSLWLGAAATPLFAAPTSYQATGPILEMTDTTITIQFHGKEKWTFSKDASTTGAEGLKVGDSVTVHYTMAAASVEASKSGAKADKKAAKADKKAAAPAAKTDAAASPAASPAQ